MKTYDIKSIMLGIGLGLVIASIININTYGNYGRVLSDDILKMEATKRGFIIFDPEDIINKNTINENSGNISSAMTNNKKYDEEVKIEIMKGYDALQRRNFCLRATYPRCFNFFKDRRKIRIIKFNMVLTLLRKE